MPRDLDRKRLMQTLNRQRERERIENPPPRPRLPEKPAPVWPDWTAYVMGDPPVGRRAIDQRSASR